MQRPWALDPPDEIEAALDFLDQRDRRPEQQCNTEGAEHTDLYFLDEADQLFGQLPGLRPERREKFAQERRSEEHTSELQSLMRNSYAVICLKKKNTISTTQLKQTI